MPTCAQDTILQNGISSANRFDDVTDFEICEFHKNTKISISREQNIIFSSNKKIHQLHIKCYFMTKNSFVAEVTFNESFISAEKICSSSLMEALIQTLLIVIVSV